MTQHIRPSQFVITYGPGAILEGIDGPRIIPLPDIGLFSVSGLRLEQFEISDRRMTDGLLGGARIFRLPSNAELGREQSSYLYRTKSFPGWRLCFNTDHHTDRSYVLHQRTPCPECRAAERRRSEPIRFIVACSAGHMDDVDWYRLVHGNNSGCQGAGYFRWYGGGAALSDIELECPRCGSRQNLGSVYGRSWPCSGRYPEGEPLNSSPIRPGCRHGARIIQRQASNLRIPVLRTLFSIPPRHTRLHTLLSIQAIYHSIAGHTPTSLQDFESMLDNLVKRGVVARTVVDEILKSPWQEIQLAIDDVLSPVADSYGALILEEFHTLIDASVNGVPPVRNPAPHSPVIFHVDPNLVRRFCGPRGTRFRVTPILRLRTVMVQMGYRREVDTDNPAQMVSVHFQNGQDRWYPGTEFLGEGIFVMFDDDDGWNSGLTGNASERWTAAFNSSNYPDYVFRDERHREELHPQFVWWHTLSHLLIRAISSEAGYSSASIRERVYFESNGTHQRAAILLYTTQPGSEGTLGGLIAMVPHFQHMFGVSFEQLRTCSGDPLCIDQIFRPGMYNGAACYSCLLLSETSCEHRNMWLDRHVLLENLP
jgi:hypothetical protein